MRDVGTTHYEKGITDPRSLLDPRPETEVVREGARGIGNLRRASDANCKVMLLFTWIPVFHLALSLNNQAFTTDECK